MKKHKNSTTRKTFRQGDILITSAVEQTLTGPIIQPENGKVILAHGEVTGHHHAILDPEIATLRIAGDTDTHDHSLLLIAEATLTHQEHDPIPLKRGKYTIRRQTEYSPESIRSVQD